MTHRFMTHRHRMAAILKVWSDDCVFIKKIMFLYDAVQTSKPKKYDLQGLVRET